MRPPPESSTATLVDPPMIPSPISSTRRTLALASLLTAIPPVAAQSRIPTPIPVAAQAEATPPWPWNDAWTETVAACPAAQAHLSQAYDHADQLNYAVLPVVLGHLDGIDAAVAQARARLQATTGRFTVQASPHAARVLL